MGLSKTTSGHKAGQIRGYIAPDLYVRSQWRKTMMNKGSQRTYTVKVSSA